MCFSETAHPLCQLPSRAGGLPCQGPNLLLVHMIKSGYFRLIGTLLIDLHFLLFHLITNTPVNLVTAGWFTVSVQVPACVASFYGSLFQEVFPHFFLLLQTLHLSF